MTVDFANFISGKVYKGLMFHVRWVIIMTGGANFEQIAEPIPQNVENTLERAVRDYSNHWQGVIGEAIQNSIDGYFTNKEDRGTVGENQKLIIELEVDSEQNKFVWRDNAGGMPGEIFLNKFPGLDTPGPEKEKGKGIGAWGRGVHVIVGAASDNGRAVAETKHGDYEGKIEIRKSRYAKIEDFESQLDKSGTEVHVHNLRPRVLMDLTDWSQVQEYIQARFQRALENEDIEIRFKINGKNRVVKPFDLSSYDVLWEGELNFGEDDEETLRKVVIYEKPKGEEIPFEGISMNKSNEYLDEPFMRVKEFTPHNVRNLNQMFGFCDASVLCPEHENNAHNDFLRRQAVNRAYAALREKLNELDAEHFLGREDNVKERQELVDEALDRFQDFWGDENPINADEGEFPLGNGKNDDDGQGNEGEDDDDGDKFDEGDGDGNSGKEKEKPNITLEVGERVFEAGENVEASVEIETDESKAYSVRGHYKDPDGNETDLKESNAVEMSGNENEADTTKLRLWTIEPDNKGKYVLYGELVDEDKGEVVYETSTFFYYGVNPFVGGESSGPGIDVDWMIDGPEEMRYHISEQETSLILNVNTSHPEWQVAEKRDTGDNIDHQATLLAQWFQEATMLHSLKDELGEETEAYRSVKEKLVEKNSAFAASNYRRYV